MEDLSFPSINATKLMESEQKFESFSGNESNNKVRRKPKIRKMYFAALAALSLYLSLGLCTGYSSQATNDMEHRKNSVIHPSQEEISWISSIVTLGLIAGSIFAGL